MNIRGLDTLRENDVKGDDHRPNGKRSWSFSLARSNPNYNLPGMRESIAKSGAAICATADSSDQITRPAAKRNISVSCATISFEDGEIPDLYGYYWMIANDMA